MYFTELQQQSTFAKTVLARTRHALVTPSLARHERRQPQDFF